MRRLLIIASSLAAAACASAAPGPRVVNDPCRDPQYLALKGQPVDSLSAREFEVLREHQAACARVTEVVAASAASPSRRPPRRLETDAWTQAMANETGSEIHIRNRSDVPILVTEVTLTACINLADPCGSHRPRVRIEPGDARRVLRVRYGFNGVAASFQYRYMVEPANPEDN